MPEVFSLPLIPTSPQKRRAKSEKYKLTRQKQTQHRGYNDSSLPLFIRQTLQSTGAPHHPLMDDPTSRSEKTEITRQNLTFPPPNLPVAAPCTLPSQSNFSIFNMYFISPPWFQGLLLQLFPCSCNINFSPSTNSFSISTQTCSSTSYLRGEKKTSLDSPNISMCNIFLIHFVLT